MKTYFCFETNSIIAVQNNIAYDMRTGLPTEQKCDAVLNEFAKLTTSEWLDIHSNELLNSKVHEIADSTATNSFVIGGHTVTVRYRDNMSQIQFIGKFPRYFWKGLATLLELR